MEANLLTGRCPFLAWDIPHLRHRLLHTSQPKSSICMMRRTTVMPRMVAGLAAFNG